MKLFCFFALFASFFATGIGCQAQAPDSTPKTNTASCDVTTEDYAVFTAVVQNLGAPEDPEEAWASKEILIADETAQTSKNEVTWSGWGMRSRSNEKPHEATIEDFRTRSSAKCAFEASFAEPGQYALLPKQELEKTFKKGPAGWENFYKKHPNAAGYWDFSRPGFDSDGHEALLYVGHHCGGLCGTGHLFLLRKEDGKWRVVGRSMLWIS